MELDRNTVYLLLGSNLGDRESVLKQAIQHITANIGNVDAQSSIYETEPWGNTNQPGFLNMALKVSTLLPATQVLEQALAIEQHLGRLRLERWGSRIIDIDIIFYNADIVQVKDQLTIPHPEMQNRKFVLEPLCEIAPDFVHPILKKNIKELYETLNDISAVKRFNA
jgi:2-amino-4-hydroxy-6-hydroxymethyldihydropteridine diphosphokinase